MIHILKYRFTGNQVPREEFKREFKQSVVGFLGYRDTRLMFLVLEIAKNIWDHANGEGHAIFIKKGHMVAFMIRDRGKKVYDLEAIKHGGTSKPESGHNFGSGLCVGMIEASAKQLGISLRINTSRGFSYKGIYLAPLDQ